MLTALRAMLPPGAGAAWSDPHVEYPLLPGEDLPRATPARLREFAAGRHAARAALHAIGVVPTAIAHGADRAPVWPAGVIGSITHTGAACLAVAMRSGDMRGIGVDLEPIAPLDPALWETILLPSERAAVLQGADPGLAAMQIFCAKEAAFKAHYPTTRALVGFEVMVVTLGADGFGGVLQTALPPLAKGATIHGRIAMADGHILTLALL